MIETVKLNLKLLWKKYKTGLSVITAALSFILLFMDKEKLGINGDKTGCIIAIIILILPLVYAMICVLTYRSVKINDNEPTITVKYGDIWKEAFPKKSSGKRIVVINVNTTFDVIVDKELSEVDKPLVSPITLHGQWINIMMEKGKSPEELLKSIKENLALNGVRPINKISQSVKSRGELNRYEKGTIAVYEFGNTIFYLLALSEFDENNNAQNSKKELLKTIKSLLEFYDKHGQGNNLYIPLIGSGLSRTGIDKKEALETLSMMLCLYAKNLQGDVNIIVYKGDRDKVSIDVR